MPALYEQIALGSVVSGVTATIAATATESSVIPLLGNVPVLIQIPASFTGTSISFLVCDTAGGTFTGLYGGDGNLISMTVAPSRAYVPVAANFEGAVYLKIKSGSAEVGAKTLTLSLKGK